MPWFDAGINLLDKRFDAEDIVTSAVAAGVERLCVITTHPDEWDAAAALYQQYPDNLCYTVGIHPHNAKEAGSSVWPALKKAAARPGVVAIGECGLDFNRMFSPREQQLEVFEQQLAIACSLNMPVYLHERDAFSSQIQLLQQYASRLTAGGIAHCFTGPAEQMQAYLALGLFVGITGWVCDDKRGELLQQALKRLPADRVILETDGPYLFPKTLKPRRRNNDPTTIPHIGQYVANLMNISQAQLMQVSYANTCRLFSLS